MVTGKSPSPPSFTSGSNGRTAHFDFSLSPVDEPRQDATAGLHPEREGITSALQVAGLEPARGS